METMERRTVQADGKLYPCLLRLPVPDNLHYKLLFSTGLISKDKAGKSDCFKGDEYVVEKSENHMEKGERSGRL